MTLLNTWGSLRSSLFQEPGDLSSLAEQWRDDPIAPEDDAVDFEAGLGENEHPSEEAQDANLESPIASSRESVISPLIRLLECPPVAIAIAGPKAIEHLRKADERVRNALLWWFGLEVLTAWRVNRYDIRNRVAALEILTRFSSDDAPHILEIALHRSFSEYHLYLISMVRLVPDIAGDQRLRIASRIVVLLREAPSQPSMPPEWHRRFLAETLKTLAELSPRHAFGVAGEMLPGFDGLELTAILESLCEAARRDSEASKVESLGHALHEMWGRFVDASARGLVNRAGILARLLELRGRIHGTLAESQDFLAPTSTLRTQVLYLLMNRPLEFLQAAERKHIYVLTLSALVDSGQLDSFNEVFARLLKGADGTDKTWIAKAIAQALKGIARVRTTGDQSLD